MAHVGIVTVFEKPSSTVESEIDDVAFTFVKLRDTVEFREGFANVSLSGHVWDCRKGWKVEKHS